MKIVVVGASTGLGRCIGIGLAKRGANVALLARRAHLLEEAAHEAGSSAVAITCDVTDDASCQESIVLAAQKLGGINSVVYCTGIGILRRIEALESVDWERSFATNVIGASRITAAALPYLAASGGVAAYLSSVSASLTSPWPGLAAYTVSKAALDKLVEAWRSEHPEIGFSRVIVGECTGGEGAASSHFVDTWDTDLTAELFAKWMERGVLTDKVMDIDHLVGAVDAVLRVGASACIPSIAITPRRAI